MLAPLGFLATGALWPRAGGMRRGLAAVAAFGGCIVFIAGVKYAQLFFPPRTVSLNYILAQSLGCLLGVGLFALLHERLSALRGALAGGGRRALAIVCAALRAGAVCLLPVSVRFCAEPDRFARAGRRRAAPAAVMAGRGPAGEPAPDHGAGGDRGDRSDRFIAGSGAAPDFVVADRRHRLSADVGRGGDQPVSARRRAVAWRRSAIAPPESSSAAFW